MPPPLPSLLCSIRASQVMGEVAKHPYFIDSLCMYAND